MSTKKFSPFGPAVLPGTSNIYIYDVLFYYIDGTNLKGVFMFSKYIFFQAKFKELFWIGHDQNLKSFNSTTLLSRSSYRFDFVHMV